MSDENESLPGEAVNTMVHNTVTGLVLDGRSYSIKDLWNNHKFTQITINVDEYDGKMEDIRVQFFQWPGSQTVSCRVMFGTGFELFGDCCCRGFNGQLFHPEAAARWAFGAAVKKFKVIAQYKMAVGLIGGHWSDSEQKLV